MENKTNNLIDFLYVLVKWRKLIIINFIIVSFLAAGISLMLPHVYKANTTVLPSSEDTGTLGLSSLLSSVPMSGLGFGSVSGELYQFLSILNSRTIMELAVQKFNLVQRYKQENMEEAVKILRENVNENVNDDGTLTLSCNAATKWIPDETEIEEARLCAKNMANFFIVKMDSINKSLKTQSAKNNRIFIEKRYQQNISDLREAENKLKEFQEKHGTIALEQQTQATIGAAAEIKSKMIAKQIELNALKHSTGPSNLQIQTIENQIQTLKSKIEDFYTKQDNLFISLGEAPTLQVKYGRLMRNVMLQQKIMEFLLPQYEQAKIQEAKDTPTVQVLDDAVKPIKRTKPKRSFFVIFWAFLSVFITIFVILLIEYIDKLKVTNQDKYEKILRMKTSLRNDFKRKNKSI